MSTVQLGTTSLAFERALNSALNELDRQRLHDALELAEFSIGLSDPNPRVGCVIGSPNGAIVGKGFTQRAGEPHAEVMALLEAGQFAKGATAWVTLEPCAHFGRTPPCCDALIDAGIARVVVAIGDPFPHVDGRGIGRLRAAGVTVDMADESIASLALQLNIGFFSRVQRGRPWVRLKTAVSMDGRTSLPDGTSQWITGEAARHDGHLWRARAGVILTGIGTMLRDDPQLDVRGIAVASQPMRVVVDSNWRTPISARLFSKPSPVLVVGASTMGAAAQELRSVGAQTLMLIGANGQVDLQALMQLFAQREINEVHVEAGPTLNARLIDAGLVDELLMYMAPSLLGAGHGVANLEPPGDLGTASRFRFLDCQQLGVDLRIRAQVLPRAAIMGTQSVEKIDTCRSECPIRRSNPLFLNDI